jgi:hypothetical protein
MQRCVFTSLGVLEAAVALVLLGFAWYLPGPSDVHDKVERVRRALSVEHRVKSVVCTGRTKWSAPMSSSSPTEESGPPG